ncbi:MAG: tRNA (5-methylaminomethyl-2-thiouridine)(34)-methyltransferase MnmD [Flammeovirgaceae bacterium]
MMKHIITADGSSSLYHEALNETYHSKHGAMAESKYVFIQNGLEEVFKSKDEVKLLEVGFGTGLNAFLSIEIALKFPQKKIYYCGLEPYPIPVSFLQQGNEHSLNYTQNYEEKLQKMFFQIHDCEWNKEVWITHNFQFLKLKTKLEDVCLQTDFYDLVYFDAFAPNKQPEMWSKSQFEKLYLSLKTGGFLVTYCAQGEFKRTLKSVGFEVKALQGPKGKREMTMGIKRS